MKFPENIGINEHVIELMEGKQSPYRSIYVFNSVKLETLKTHIETHFKTEFIRPSKSPIGTSILFDKKRIDSLRLYVNYRGLNNLIIENQ